MEERSAAVIDHDKPLTVIGSMLKPGAAAPDAVLEDNGFNPVKLSDYAGKIRLISVVPSLSTSICDAQTRRFNEEASGLGREVVILTISADLPFTQKHWCAAAGVERVVTLSDHHDMAFGKAYGTAIKEMRIEQRSIFVVDRQNIIRYVEYVPEIGRHVDFEAALAAVRALL